MVNPAITHSQGVSGAGATTGGVASEVAIGTTTLPRPGPWNIWGVWFTTAPDLPTTAEQHQSRIRIDDINADIMPTPTPFSFPTYSQAPVTGTGGDSLSLPYHVKPVKWIAAGGTQLRFLETQATTVTVANQVGVGVFYGVKPTMYDVMFQDVIANHYESVEGTADTTAETTAGTVSLSEKAKIIVGLAVDVVMTTAVEGESLSGLARIQSDDVDLPPFTFPFAHVTSAPLESAEADDQAVGTVPKMMPVHIPVPAGAAIEFLTTLDIDVGTAAETVSYIAYI